MKRPRSAESGQALVLVLLCMTVMLGFVGFAVDVGQLIRTKQILQTAADSAAIAGAQEINYPDVTTAAKAAATMNGITDGSNGVTVTVNHPPLNGPHTSNNNYVEVIVTQTQPGSFMQMIPGVGRSTLSARSVATNGPSHNCLYTLGTTGTDIDITGIADFNMPNCGIIVNSTSGSAIDAEAVYTSIDAGSIAVVGGVTSSWLNFNSSPFNCSLTSSCPTTGAAPTPDPLSYFTDPTVPGPPNCNGSTTITGNVTLNPGCWSGLKLNGGNVVFNPGTTPYIINGDLTITSLVAGVTGTGVTFYVTGAINFSGAQYLNLSAPTSGTYNGMLFVAPPNDTHAMTFTGIQWSQLNGIIYLPGSAMAFEGISSTTFNNSIIVKSISITGIGQVNDYAMINTTTPLTGTRLAE